ncbi:MAG: hypothetical protein CM15mP18_2220 [Methanobacteriota archaeon]|nr:MAG: hypothetical protein CM15mP18_2220 [Euryarchaeota archaeon]
MRFGVTAYLMAFIGAVLLLVEIGLIELDFRKASRRSISGSHWPDLHHRRDVDWRGARCSGPSLTEHAARTLQHRDPRRIAPASFSFWCGWGWSLPCGA